MQTTLFTQVCFKTIKHKLYRKNSVYVLIFVKCSRFTAAILIFQPVGVQHCVLRHARFAGCSSLPKMMLSAQHNCGSHFARLWFSDFCLCDIEVWMGFQYGSVALHT